MREEIEHNDILDGIDQCKINNGSLNIYWMKEHPNKSALTFDKDFMTDLWNKGYAETDLIIDNYNFK